MITLIVSGSRWATDAHAPHIEDRLAFAAGLHRSDAGRLVHGGARGVDTIAAGIARRWGWEPIVVPADWQTCDADLPPELGGCPGRPHLRVKAGRTYCPLAGHRRNQRMIREYGDNATWAVCFPAIGGGTGSGTGDFIDRAIRAGLPHLTFPLDAVRPDQGALFGGGGR